MEQCPICAQPFPARQLELHVNTCLDSQEKRPKRERSRSKSRSRSPRRRAKKNPFKALGLKMDLGDRARPDRGKATASLTALLITERRMKERNRRARASATEGGAGSGASTTSPNASATSPNSSANSKASGPNSKASGSTNTTNSSTNKTSPGGNSSPSASTTFGGTGTGTGTKQALAGPVLEALKLKQAAKTPLAQRLRPKSLDDFFGQEKLVGPNGLLRNMITALEIPSFILWGVPGVGKTTLARIIANSTNYRFIEISGPSATASRLREVFTAADNDRKLTGNRTLIFLDEIHRFNKAQQDLLLPVIERGTVTVLGATTENPSFTLNNALLSRMHTFVMESLSHDALVKILNRGLYLLNQTRKLVYNLHLISLKRDAIDYIAELSAGDARVSLNILESINAYLSGTKFAQKEPGEELLQVQMGLGLGLGVIKIDKSIIKPLLSTRNYQKMYDHHGESHYDTISAFHKSVRGLDPDAAIFYLTKMLNGGEDPLFIARRMIVIASEDIGLRDSSCLPFAVAAKDALEFLGMPEGEIVLAHCAVRLAKAPKSTKSYRALRSAQTLFNEKSDIMSYRIPLHLRNAPTKLMKDMGYGDTYRYNPNYENGVVAQKYLPEELEDVTFVDDKHLGESRDPEVSDQQYEEADLERKQYLEFKLKRRQLKEQLVQEAIAKAEAEEYDETSSIFPYDEFLSKEDQPDYFDGQENDHYEADETFLEDDYSEIIPDLLD